MVDQHIGGLDQRFAPRKTGGLRSTLLLLAVLAGAGVGAWVASRTVPHPNCLAGDGMCRLQKLYLAQAVKVLGCTLAVYLVADVFVVRAPNAVADRRRRAAFVRTHSPVVTPLPSRTFDASTAREALSALNAPTTLPPAALRALAAAPPALGTVTARAARRTTPALVDRLPRKPEPLWEEHPTPGAPRAPRPTVAAVAPRPAPRPAPAPEEPAPRDAHELLERMGRGPGLPPAALDALLARGPALGGSRARRGPGQH